MYAPPSNKFQKIRVENFRIKNTTDLIEDSWNSKVVRKRKKNMIGFATPRGIYLYTMSLKAMWNTMECQRDSFNSSLGGARKTHWECVSHCHKANILSSTMSVSAFGLSWGVNSTFRKRTIVRLKYFHVFFCYRFPTSDFGLTFRKRDESSNDKGWFSARSFYRILTAHKTPSSSWTLLYFMQAISTEYCHLFSEKIYPRDIKTAPREFAQRFLYIKKIPLFRKLHNIYIQIVGGSYNSLYISIC